MKRYRRQPFPGPCAQYALVNTMAVIGISLTVREAHKLTGVSLWRAINEGTDTTYIVKAIRKCGCTPHLVFRTTEEAAQRSLDRLLRKGFPVIISVDDSSHWAVIASKTKKGYRWIDSADSQLTGYWNWDSIAEWAEDEEDGFCFVGVEGNR